MKEVHLDSTGEDSLTRYPTDQPGKRHRETIKMDQEKKITSSMHSGLVANEARTAKVQNPGSDKSYVTQTL